MNSKEIIENHQRLFQVGFTQVQIERLSRFRSSYLAQEEQHTLKELRRMEFVRWLVMTGRLTEQEKTSIR